MPAPAAASTDTRPEAAPKQALQIRIREDVDRNVTERVTRVPVKDETQAPAVRDYYRDRPLPPTEGGDPMATPAAGGGGGGGASKAWNIVWIAVAVLILLYGFKHFVNGEPLFGTGGYAVQGQFRSGPGTPGGGYVRGAPRNAAECVKRGGTNTGRGCDGYN
ncbi:MAG: hypothetical protein WC050_02120 [Candidatus Paceibacterota bacterium]